MKPTAKRVFVFGSNLAGIHGAGSAFHAWKFHGAEWGVGVGPKGDSYAIPTKDEKIQTLPIGKIQVYVWKFLGYAKVHRDVEFEVVRIGCGLAGFTDAEMAPLFRGAPSNVQLPEGWR